MGGFRLWASGFEVQRPTISFRKVSHASVRLEPPTTLNYGTVTNVEYREEEMIDFLSGN
jgi:hypothetical protein